MPGGGPPSAACRAWGRLAVGGLVGHGPLGAGFIAECGDGGFDGREEVAWVDGAGEPVAFDLGPYRALELGEDQADALGVQRLVQVLQDVGSGGVHVGHRLRGDQDPDRCRVGPGEPPDLVAERLGVGEEQRGVEPVDHQAGQAPGIGIAADVVVALQPVHAPEHRVVGPPGPPEDVEDGQADGDRDPGQHAEQGDAEERRDRQQELGLALRHSRAVAGMSARDSDAVITTAARAGWGRFRNRPGTSTIIRMIRAAPMTPVSCVFAPDRSATAVRDPLVLTGNPWNRPAARFAAPMPIIRRCRGLPARCGPRTPTRWRSCQRERPARCRGPRRTGARDRTGGQTGSSAAGTPWAAPRPG